MASSRRSQSLELIALLVAASLPFGAQAASDPGTRACAQEARRLCPAEMKTMSRKKVEACMIAKVEQTSPVCHAAMMRIKDERDARREGEDTQASKR